MPPIMPGSQVPPPHMQNMQQQMFMPPNQMEGQIPHSAIPPHMDMHGFPSPGNYGRQQSPQQDERDRDRDHERDRDRDHYRDNYEDRSQHHSGMDHRREDNDRGDRRYRRDSRDRFDNERRGRRDYYDRRNTYSSSRDDDERSNEREQRFQDRRKREDFTPRESHNSEVHTYIQLHFENWNNAVHEFSL